jgi:hypothetical protein
MPPKEFTRQELDAVLGRLQGCVWHTTNSERFRGIVRCAAILPEPDIKDSDRWSTSLGSEYYPYVRTLGGVSLFDFRDFDPEHYSEVYPNSMWREFVPYRPAWGEAVWIEIDVSLLGDAFISGPALLARWKADTVGNRIMPQIEAAHLGPLPRSAFKEVLLVTGDADESAHMPLDVTQHFLGI